jgi:hypothetical protein
MFLASRVANGIVSVLAFFLAIAILLSGQPDTGSLVVGMGLIPLTYLLDCVFRKRGQRVDRFFAISWTAWFALGLYVGIRMLAGSFPDSVGGPLVFGMTLGILCGIPFLINGVYVLRLIHGQNTIA